jgi:hypothetical protein
MGSHYYKPIMDPITPKKDNPELKKLLTCSLCNDYFNFPVTLSCQHTFCLMCLEATGEECKCVDEIIKIPKNCPICKTKTFCPPVNNFVLQNILDEALDDSTKKRLEEDYNNKVAKRTLGQTVYFDTLKSDWRKYMPQPTMCMYYEPPIMLNNANQHHVELQNEEPQDEAREPEVVDVIADGLMCPVCKEALCEAVTLTCQHTFCRSCLEVKNVNKCPMCSLQISTLPVNDNLLMLNLVQAVVDPDIKKKYDTIKKKKEIAKLAVPLITDAVKENEINKMAAVVRPYPILAPQRAEYDLCCGVGQEKQSRLVKFLDGIQNHLVRWGGLYNAAVTVAILIMYYRK